MKKSHQITLTPLSKESVPEPDFLVCKKCNTNKPKDAYRKANLWRAKVCMECDYASKKAKIAENKKDKDLYAFY